MSSSTPLEIFRVIVRLAAASHTSYCVEYEPFQPIQELAETVKTHKEERERLQTCLALSLVSNLFRETVVEFLYEDVRICDESGLSSLISGLQRSAREDGENAFGRYIRRLELPCRRVRTKQESPPPPSQPFPTYPIPYNSAMPTLCGILELCPRLEILVRPCLRLDAPNIVFWANLVNTPVLAPLPSLRRLEWHETDLDPRFYGANNSARLREIVALAPNLGYFFLSTDRPTALADLSLPTTLHTLRMSRSHFHPQLPDRRTALRPRYPGPPTVRNLVLHTPLSSPLLDFVEAGTQLRVLELAFAPQMLFSGGQLRRILARAPALEELVYHVGAPEIAALGGGVQAPNIKRVRLKVDSEEWNPCKPVLRSQMEVLEGESFPCLQEIVLHDSAGWFVRREIGREALRRLLRRGCVVRYADGTPVEVSL